MRTIRQVAVDIVSNWKMVSPAARPYLQAMLTLDSINDMYYQDSARGIVLYFLANAQGWRGDKAREIKSELKNMLNEASN